ncbi:T9SS type A sorting domain-containing protein [Antarcticibacterium sp. 1MA-6-2]|uniref:T9SS type A sorting domain-containing protein n=1 Tax=Antarcticibacterium sp. 1MA-6-2 TaxID=2908210 RepID=UPI001F47F551|nr:T9SS type A sorting domain-containing protein [Antarcticibacterium sp. 1MA-6-2]UJH93048.1 T9SS type A sorting domain-containing protein [Antarcticibacterium sp. 1MA-6-2]
MSKVEIFDFRGRFLFTKKFAEDVPAYNVDVSGVEQAVYVLRIYTSDGKRIRRVIKN